ncbi:hypothetical protein BJ878DRAFT_550486 [Calycina marina]|uniref:Methyltransferase type 11 domain-containing protein n=1 Tax=Calycina marina TaxID=1763456 RepID=A0A9P7Z342_9HELO|nr:hypothetical protein BJ878DRAFT_550486 [Calycina marina]
MFDIAWSDPAAETVGQRRARKENGVEKPYESTRRGSIKTTSSSNSSQAASTSKDKLGRGEGWGFFGVSKKMDKGKEKEKSIRSSKSTSPSERKPGAGTPSMTILTSRTDREQEIPLRMTKSRANESRPNERSRSRAELEHLEQQEKEYLESVQSHPTPIESVFSIPTFRSGPESSWGGSVSEMGSSKNNQSSPSRSYKGRSYLASNKSYYDDLNTVKNHPSEARFSIGEDDESVYRINHDHRFPQAPTSSRAPSSTGAPSSSARSFSRMKGQMSSQLSASGQNLRPPPKKNLPEIPRPENSAIRLRLRRMETASPKIILQRLVEEWDEGEDEAIYNELEFEKQLWMLVGLTYSRRDASFAQSTGMKSPLEPCNVLSLYDNNACASMLSTMYPIGSKTHHLSMHPPSSIEQTSHLHTLIVTIVTTTLPYAPSTFTTISSLRLPMIVPASSIPSMLGECHRVLNNGGTLQLTVIDPLPIATTMGPKMRVWLEDHLLLKLETQFRCLKPGKLMPIWLADAGFRTAPRFDNQGATVCATETSSKTSPVRTGFSFRAIGRGEGGYRGSSRAKDQVDMLASTVGRMLWKEIYGPYVGGQIWWWEDEHVVDECYNMGTKWDVTIIEAIKS